MGARSMTQFLNPPPGFVLERPGTGGHPPLPPGFQLDTTPTAPREQVKRVLSEPETDFNEAVLGQFARRQAVLKRELTGSEQRATVEALRQQFKGIAIPDAERVRQQFERRRLDGIDPISNSVLAALEVPAGLVRGTIGAAAPKFAAEYERKAAEPGNFLQPRAGASQFVGQLAGTAAIIVPAAIANKKAAAKLLPALFGISQFGQVRADIATRRESGEDISRAREFSAASLSGAAEAAFEAMGLRLLKQGGKVLKKAVPEFSKAIATGSWDAINAVSKRALQGLGIVAGGAGEEGATLLTQNLVANLYKDQQLTENFVPALLSGALLPVIGAPAIAISGRGGRASELDTADPVVSETPAVQEVEKMRQEGKEQEAAQRALLISEVSPPDSVAQQEAETQLAEIRDSIEMELPAPPPSNIPPTVVEDRVAAEQVPKPLRDTQMGQDLEPPSDVEMPPRSVSETLQTVNDELRSTTAAVFQPVTKFSKGIVGLARKHIPRATGVFRQLGQAGEQMADDYEAVGERMQRRVNTDNADIRETVYKGLNRAQREQVGRLANGRIPPDSVPPELRKRAENLRRILDRGLDEWAALGGRRRMPDGSSVPAKKGGKPYPQFLSREGRKALDEARRGQVNPRLQEWAQRQVAEGRVLTEDAAIRHLVHMREQQSRGINPYLESTRVELPDAWIDWDGSNKLPALLEKNWAIVEGARQWGLASDGFSLQQLEAQITQIEAEHGRKTADQIRSFAQASFGRGSSASQQAQDISGAVRGFQFVSKIAVSPLTIMRNMTDRFAKGFAVGSLTTNLKATMKFPPFINQFTASGRKIMADAERAGAIFGHGSLTEGVEAGSAVTKLISTPFTVSEKGNQAYMALVAKLQLEKDMFDYAKLNKRSNLGKIFQSVASFGNKNQGALQARLERAGLSGEQLTRLESMDNEALSREMINSEEMTPEIMATAMHRMVRDSTFPVMLSTKRLWWDNNPAMRVLTQFKVWPVEQTVFAYNHAVLEAVKHKNFAPMGRFMVATALAGELYNIIRDALFGKEESAVGKIIAKVKGQDISNANIAWHFAKDFADGGGIGMFADMVYGVGNFAAGPAWATTKNFGSLVNDVKNAALENRPREIPAAFNKFINRESSAVRQANAMWARAENKFMGKANRLIPHTTWRERAYEFRADNESEGVRDEIKKGMTRFIFGFETFPAGDNTLSNQAIARQIVVGDINDAAALMTDRLEEATDAKERSKIMTQFRSARSSYSPLGPLSKRLQNQLLKAFPEEDQKQARALQLEWFKNYSKAMKMAFQEVKRERSTR